MSLHSPVHRRNRFLTIFPSDNLDLFTFQIQTADAASLHYQALAASFRAAFLGARLPGAIFFADAAQRPSL